MLAVKLVYVRVDQTLVHFELSMDAGSTVGDALTQSGIYLNHPETQAFPVGIFSKQVTLDTPLRENDRIEIYRPLTVNPMEKRRQRAKISSRTNRAATVRKRKT